MLNDRRGGTLVYSTEYVYMMVRCKLFLYIAICLPFRFVDLDSMDVCLYGLTQLQ